MWSLALAALLLGLGFTSLPAQRPSPFDSIDTPHGRCAVWVAIPGGSGPADTTYTRCAIDSGPDLLTPPRLPAPRFERSAHGSITVVVRPDGTVDPDRTRPRTASMDRAFDEALLERVRSWRFRAGVREGRPVRAGFVLEVRSDLRDDTVPARLRWSYRRGLNEDTVVGRWEPAPTAPPLTPEAADSVLASVLRELERQRVLVSGRPYCLVDDAADSAAYRARSALLGELLAVDSWSVPRRGCEEDPRFRRLVVAGAHPTEENRVVVELAGDWLEKWPRGFDGHDYRAWTARCVADPRALGGEPALCHALPLYEPGPLLDPGAPTNLFLLPGAPPADTFRMAVVARTSGAVYNDTLNVVVGRLADWKDSGDWYRAPHAVHCNARSGCTEREALPPEQRALADSAHLRFRLSDLRPGSRTEGGWLQLRIHTNRRVPDHHPVVVVRRGDDWNAEPVRNVTWGVWEYGVITDYPPDTEVRVYIVRDRDGGSG